MSHLPPGRSGLPLVGETLSFLKDPFGFIARRMKEHGPIVRSHILGRPTAIIAGPEAAEKWLDERLVAREGSMPANIQSLFGGRSLPLLDGVEHKDRKRLVMAAFSREAIASYIADMDRTVSAHLERLLPMGEVALIPELKRLAIEIISTNILGLAAGPDLDRLRADYERVARGFTVLPVRLPGTAYHAALRARDRIFAFLDEQVRSHRPDPGGDGLSRMLAARAPSGTALAPEQARLEIHHVVLAGFIVFGELAAIVIELHRHQDVLRRVREDVETLPRGEPLTVDALDRLPYLRRFTMEVKRTCLITSVSAGRTKAPFELSGHTVPPGWQLLMAVGECNRFPSVYADPEAFDPDRFAPGREEHRKHPHAYVPQGVGGEDSHRCAGLDYATYLMEVYTVRLLQTVTWELPPQDLSLRREAFPPEPKGGLLVKLRRADSRPLT